MADKVKKEEVTYCQTIDEFLADNPDISPDWRDFMKPVVQGADDRIYTLIMSSIFS